MTPQTSFKRVVIEHDDAKTLDMEEGGVEAVKARTGNTGAGGADAGKAGGVSEIEREEETEDTLTNASKSTAPTLANSCPKRTVRTPVRDDDLRYSVSSYSTRKRTAEKAKVAQVDTPADPCTYTQAMARADAAEWEVACEAERRAFEHMGVYKIVPRPKGQKVVGSKWVFRIKRRPNGEISIRPAS